MIEFLRRLFAWWRPHKAAPPPPQEPPPPPQEPPRKRKPIDPDAVKARLERRKIFRLREAIARDANKMLDALLTLSYRNTERLALRDQADCLEQLYNRDFMFFDHAHTMPGSSEFFFNPTGEEAEFAQAVWPIDCGVAITKEDGLDFYHIETTNPAELRGKIKLVPSKIVTLRNVHIGSDDWFADTRYVGLFANNWIFIDQGITQQQARGGVNYHRVRLASSHLRQEVQDTVGMMFSVAFNARYAWHAALGVANGPRLLIPTNPSGCLALFANRKKGDAEARRAALRHWVHNHYRENDQDLIYVRDHLRGTVDFEWYDLIGEIRVSEFDLEKNEAFKREADEWRRKRRHNRVRVRLKQKATA